MPSCAVITCKSRSQVSNIARSGVSFHRFPQDPALRVKWIEVTGRIVWIPTKCSTICSKHFRVNDFMFKGSGRRFLIEGAIPTRNVAYLINKDVTPSFSNRDLEAEVGQEFDVGDPMESGDEDACNLADFLAFKKKCKAIGIDNSYNPVHRGVTCAFCVKEIAGYRYMCLQCADLNLCVACETTGLHPQHCMLRLPSPYFYASTLPFLEPLKSALNETIFEDAPQFETYNIKQEPDDEPMMEITVCNTAPTRDPLSAPKPVIDEKSAVYEDNAHIDTIKAETGEFYNNNNPAREITDTNLPSASRDIITNKTSCVPSQHQQSSKHKQKTKVQDTGTNITSAVTRDDKIGVNTASILKEEQVDDPPKAETQEIYDIKTESLESDTDESFTEYGSHR